MEEKVAENTQSKEKKKISIVSETSGTSKIRTFASWCYQKDIRESKRLKTYLKKL